MDDKAESDKLKSLFRVQKNQCSTCIYRPDNPLDLAQLEDDIADGYDSRRIVPATIPMTVAPPAVPGSGQHTRMSSS